MTSDKWWCTKNYVSTRWCKIVEEGPSDLFFDTDDVDKREKSFVSEVDKE